VDTLAVVVIAVLAVIVVATAVPGLRAGLRATRPLGGSLARREYRAAVERVYMPLLLWGLFAFFVALAASVPVVMILLVARLVSGVVS
jgi:hypothetical protein